MGHATHRFAPLILAAFVALPAVAAIDSTEPIQPGTSPAILVAAATDYGDLHNWLCWPGRSEDACSADLTTTVIDANGRTTIESFRPAKKPPIDCFYVYPTVSNDPGLNASLAVEPAERLAVAQQAARFGNRCRLFAPLYRQVTLAGLRAALSGHPLPGSDDPTVRDAGYNDVKGAWEYYLAHENHGRGVVLLGHSQGSYVLIRLIKSSIDGQSGQALLVSAILLGANLVVPEGADVGGDFKAIPLCRRASQTGCAIAFTSFRATAPPPPASLFGRPFPPQAGMVSACVNPASLGGGSGPLKAYLSAGTMLLAGVETAPTDWATGLTVKTPFVSLPGLLRAECLATDGANYLAITVNPVPGSPRAADIPGDIVRNGVVRKDWGLHLIDVNLTMGNLLEVVGAQSEAWGPKQSPPHR